MAPRFVLPAIGYERFILNHQPHVIGQTLMSVFIPRPVARDHVGDHYQELVERFGWAEMDVASRSAVSAMTPSVEIQSHVLRKNTWARFGTGRRVVHRV